eukprot:1388427-Amorphochlora_amoeboformis.AAC.1
MRSIDHEACPSRDASEDTASVTTVWANCTHQILRGHLFWRYEGGLPLPTSPKGDPDPKNTCPRNPRNPLENL